MIDYNNCPCGSGNIYASCCGPFINGLQLPITPEALMRSRYTAYTQANIDYIERTMLAPANINYDPNSARQWAKRVIWIKLEVLNSSINGQIGYVEFIAYFKDQNQTQTIHEKSEFHFKNNTWYYVNGMILDDH